MTALAFFLAVVICGFGICLIVDSILDGVAFEAVLGFLICLGGIFMIVGIADSVEDEQEEQLNYEQICTDSDRIYIPSVRACVEGEYLP